MTQTKNRWILILLHVIKRRPPPPPSLLIRPLGRHPAWRHHLGQQPVADAAQGLALGHREIGGKVRVAQERGRRVAVHVDGPLEAGGVGVAGADDL